jgi:hypothetical protein
MIANCTHEKVDVRSEFDVNLKQCEFYTVEDPNRKDDRSPDEIKRQEAEKKREQLAEQARQIVASGTIRLQSIKDPALLALVKNELDKEVELAETVAREARLEAERAKLVEQGSMR